MAPIEDRAPDVGAAWPHSEVVPGLHRLCCGSINAYLWRPGPGSAGDDAGGATLIDTGVAGAFDGLAAALAELAVGPDDLSAVVLTHFHDDHVGGAARVAEWSGAPVVASAVDAPYIRGRRPAPVPVMTAAEEQLLALVASDLPAAPPCRVDQEARDGDVLDVAGGAHVVAVPGHTAGSIALHLPEHRVVITGDTVMEQRGSVVLGPFSVDRAQLQHDARRLADLGAHSACFGHGDPVVGGAAARLREAPDAFG